MPALETGSVGPAAPTFEMMQALVFQYFERYDPELGAASDWRLQWAHSHGPSPRSFKNRAMVAQGMSIGCGEMRQRDGPSRAGRGRDAGCGGSRTKHLGGGRGGNRRAAPCGQVGVRSRAADGDVAARLGLDRRDAGAAVGRDVFLARELDEVRILHGVSRHAHLVDVEALDLGLGGRAVERDRTHPSQVINRSLLEAIPTADQFRKETGDSGDARADPR